MILYFLNFFQIHKKVYSMTVNVLKYYSYIQKIIDTIQLLEKEQYLRREIATVLIYELIFGNGFLPGESKVVKTIQMYENDIFHAHEVLQNKMEDNLIIGKAFFFLLYLSLFKVKHISLKNTVLWICLKCSEEF